jgi:hypothetical protein
MLLTKLKLAAVVALAVGLMGAGGGWLGYRIAAGPPAPAAKTAPAVPVADATPSKAPLDKASARARDQAAPQEESTRAPDSGSEINRTLRRTVEFPGFDERMPFSEALVRLETRYNLKFHVNQKAFKFENVQDVLKTPIVDEYEVPKMKSSLADVLDVLLNRIPAPSGATFLIRKDYVEITTGQWALAELGLTGHELPVLVYEDFEDRPWSEALRVLADRDHVSVAVDREAMTKGKEVLVTAQFHNVPAETAVRALTELADLGLARIGNVLFVTTREKAARLEKEKIPPPMGGRPRVIGEPGGGGM